jgi:metallo-beta-lactamase class B
MNSRANWHHLNRVARVLGGSALLCLLVWQLQAQPLSAATDGQRPANANPATQQFAGPLKIFDNLYYVGTTFVSAWLLVTSDGLILIDTLYEDHTGKAIEAIRALGYDPRAIRYVLITHGHQDHAGGLTEVLQVASPQVVISAADTALSGHLPDIMPGDGDTLTLGDTTVRFYLTPGHTPGVLSMQFTVRDGPNAHEAFLFGGHNVTSNSADALRAFIASVQRIRTLVSGMEVNLTSHPWAALVFQRTGLLEERRANAAHPFVDGADLVAFIDERLANAEQRLAAIEAAP